MNVTGCGFHPSQSTSSLCGEGGEGGIGEGERGRKEGRVGKVGWGRVGGGMAWEEGRESGGSGVGRREGEEKVEGERNEEG